MHLPKRWWIGLPILAGLAYLANETLTPQIEAALRERVVRRLAEAPRAVDNPRIDVVGRDVSVGGVALSPDEKRRVFAMLGAEAGLRTLNDATEPLGVASPFALKIERRGAYVTLSGNMPVSDAREKLRAELEAMGFEVEDSSAFAQGAPANFADIAGFAVKRLAELDPADAKISDATLSLSGEARSSDDLDKAVAALKTAPVGANALKAALTPPRVSPYTFSATLTGGVVALSGHLPSEDMRKTVVAMAAQAGAGAAVSDATRLGSGAPAGDFGAALTFAVSELGKLSQGKVTVADGKVTVEGQGRNNVQAATLRQDAQAGLPQGFELAKLDVQNGPVSPYVFAAARAGHDVTLTGYAPDEQTRARLVETARKRFFDAEIVDQLSVAKGAPSAFAAAAEQSLGAMARLVEGRVAMNDSRVTLSGAALFEASRRDIERGFSGALPQNFRSETLLSSRTLGGDLDAGRCADELGRLLSTGGVVFNADDSTLSPESTARMDALAAVALRCSGARIAVLGHAHSNEIAELRAARSKHRAQAVVDALVKAGVDPFRVEAIGHEAVASNETSSGGDSSNDKLIEFVVR